MFDHWVIEEILKKQCGVEQLQPQPQLPLPELPEYREPETVVKEDRGVTIISMF